MQVIINAGGTGTRLWPASTKNLPKQFAPLIGSDSFLLKTYRQLEASFDPSNIWVNTNVKFIELAKQHLPSQFLPDHILTEPEKRDNFAAICFYTALVAHHTSATEALVFIASDHLIQPKDFAKFNQGLTKMASSLENSSDYDLVIAGVKPKFASTQLGYIEVSEENKKNLFSEVVPFVKFKEKPDLQTAEAFLNSGNFLWNLSYFGLTYQRLINNLKLFWPELVDKIERTFVSGQIDPADYAAFPKISIDYALVEKIQNIGVIGLDIDWEDIGNWQILAKHLPSLNQTSQIQIGGTNNQVKLANTETKVAFVGVSDLLLVQTEDGILVINTKEAAEVKKVAEHFEG